MSETDQARRLRRATEAVVCAADHPVDPDLLAQLLEIPVSAVVAICEELAAEYDATDRGFELAKVAGGYRLQTHPDTAAYVERYVLEGQSNRLSAAALETLAIVAYKQPISRAQVSAIRGVNVDGVMRTLMQRRYIAEIARDPGPGQASLLGTTPEFLEKLGLDTLDDLPPLGQFVPEAAVVEALESGLTDREGVEPDPEAADTIDMTDPSAAAPERRRPALFTRLDEAAGDG